MSRAKPTRGGAGAKQKGGASRKASASEMSAQSDGVDDDSDDQLVEEEEEYTPRATLRARAKEAKANNARIAVSEASARAQQAQPHSPRRTTGDKRARGALESADAQAFKRQVFSSFPLCACADSTALPVVSRDPQRARRLRKARMHPTNSQSLAWHLLPRRALIRL